MLSLILVIYLTASVTRICDGHDMSASWGWPVNAAKAVISYFNNK